MNRIIRAVRTEVGAGLCPLTARLMELLANEDADEEIQRIPDDGELEGSGDDFEG